MLLRIVADNFTAGIEVGKDAAPIIRYMLPWDEKTIRDYCKRRGWRVSQIQGVGALQHRSPIKEGQVDPHVLRKW